MDHLQLGTLCEQVYVCMYFKDEDRVTLDYLIQNNVPKELILVMDCFKLHLDERFIT